MDMKPKNLLKRVLQFAREELERRAKGSELDSAEASTPAFFARAPEGARAHVQHAADEGYTGTSAIPQPESKPDTHGLEVLRPHGGGGLTLRWLVSEAEVARAEALIHGSPVLCLRLVSFTKTRDAVLREVQDRPGIERSGRVDIQEPAQRAVVALGLRAGERFVSIAHHVL